jgi:UDP-3-O-[3-hydroxymyristoyl] glucosamine N-acyltransferase
VDSQSIPLAKLAALVDGSVEGDTGVSINGPGVLESAEAGQIVFVDRPELLPAGEQSKAAALIVPPGARTQAKPIIVTEDPRLAFQKILELFAPEPRAYPGVHPTAVLGRGVTLGEGVSVGAHAVVEDNVVLRDGAIVFPLAYIGHEAEIGEETRVYPQAFVGERVIVGARCMIHAGAMLGCDGFGFLQTAQGHRKIPQIGTVILGDDVEIGACATVDRATVAATRIGRGTKIDDHVHVAHNCVIGEHCLLCGQVGIAGSTTIGNYVIMGGQAGVNDHVHIADNVIIGAATDVLGDITEPGVYSGYGARPHQTQLRVQAASVRVPDLIKKVRALEKRLQELESRSTGE